MSTSNKRQKFLHNHDTSPTVNGNDSHDLATDHSYIATHERYDMSMGLLSALLNRQIIDMSFTKLYQQSLKLGWEKIFIQERQKLKPNDVSLLKCIVLNRLLYEYGKDSDAFIQRTKCLYNEIKSRMIREFPQWTAHDLFIQVRRWQEMQCRRRLFYFSYQEGVQLPGLLMVQKASTNWCYCLINHCRQNKNFWETEGRLRFAEHFQHSFIIVAQPTGSDGAAVTQYTKSTSGHSARLNTRIVCLLDPDILKDYIELSDINVTLYPLNRESNDKKEKQPSITWEIRKVISAEGVLVSVYCADFHTLQLEKIDSDCKRLSLNSTLCQLEFRLKIKVQDPKYEETILLTTQPFGICSHAQYFPKFVAQIFLYEMKQILNNDNQITDPAIIAEFIRRYYTRMVGIEPTDHTNRYIAEVFAKIIEDVKSTRAMSTLDNMYEKILATIISQIDFMVLHPVLSLMYEDSLFLGICNSIEVDRMLRGTQDQPHLLLRFNNLTDHQWNTNPIVQFIIHDGNLKKASFDMKTFANELCRFICESLGVKTKRGLVLSTMSPRNFSDYRWYFDEELYRLNKMTAPSIDSYDPLLPILWMTMRRNDDYDEAQNLVISNSNICGRKRSRSDSLPVIDSVSSELPLPSTNIAIHFNDIPNCSLQSGSCFTQSNLTIPLAALEKDCPLNGQGTSRKNRQIIIEIPEHIDISPAVIFRYLGEKMAHMPHDQDEAGPSNYFFPPTHTAISSLNMLDVNYSRHTTSPLDYSTNDSHSSSEMAKVESSMLPHGRIPQQLKIKQEPRDVNCVILNGRVTCE